MFWFCSEKEKIKGRVWGQERKREEEGETQGRGLGQILQDLRTKAKEVGDEMTLGFLVFVF